MTPNPINYELPDPDDVPEGMEQGVDLDQGMGGQERDANRNNCGYP